MTNTVSPASPLVSEVRVVCEDVVVDVAQNKLLFGRA